MEEIGFRFITVERIVQLQSGRKNKISPAGSVTMSLDDLPVFMGGRHRG